MRVRRATAREAGAGGRVGSLDAAAERLEAFARRRLTLPGLAVGLIGPGGWRRELAVGVTDVASGRPLAPGALMPVASIGKAMPAAAPPMVPAPWVPSAAGSGSTLCTAPDLGRFLRAVVAGDPPLLASAAREAMLTPALAIPDGGYGYGLGVELDDEDGYRRVGHQGDCPGYCSYAFGCLETGVGVVALGNGPWRRPSDPASAWAVVEHGLALLRAAALGRDLPPDPPDPPAAVPEPAGAPSADPAPARDLTAELAALTGTYAAWNPWLPQILVRPAAGGGLALVWPEGDEEPLTPLPGGGFRLGDDPDSPDRVHFQAEVEGRPMQAVVSGWPFDRVG